MTVEAKRVVVYRAKDGWRWHTQDDNNEIVAESGEAYDRQAYCIKAAGELFPDARLVIADPTPE